MHFRTVLCASLLLTAGAVRAQPATALLHVEAGPDSAVVANPSGTWQPARAGAELPEGSRVRVVRGEARIFYPSGDVVRLAAGSDHEVAISNGSGDDWKGALDRGWKAFAQAWSRALGGSDIERVRQVAVHGSARSGSELPPPVLAVPQLGRWSLFSARPAFTWYSSGDDEYDVSLRRVEPDCGDSGAEYASISQADTSWSYPNDAPSLLPGESYRFHVRTVFGGLEDQTCFRVAAVAERDSLEAEIAQVRRMVEAATDDASRQDVVVALFLAERGYPLDGLIMLDGVLAGRPDDAAARRERLSLLKATGTAEKVRRRR